MSKSDKSTSITPASAKKPPEQEEPTQPAWLSKIGRPIPLTEELADQVADEVRKGLSPSIAGPTCGIAQTTLSAWLRRGADAITAYQEHGTEPQGNARLYAYLWLAVKDAEAGGSKEWLTNLRLDPKQWQRWAWLLERRNPAEYGRSQKVEVTGSLGIKPDY